MIKKFIDEEYRSSLVIIHNESEFIRCQKFYFGKGYNWYFPSKKPYTFSDIENDISDTFYIHLNHDTKIMAFSRFIQNEEILDINEEIRKEKLKRIND